ncbi:YciI family protein [uncultured Microbacterium sp.]|uniref:YciI family protein n=1 Tax=uncultured Microbacterium sp. TaxID=191216 RepID=UPI0028DAF767|nr:YciI family protein [uncultured Microbacterium sp.]
MTKYLLSFPAAAMQLTEEQFPEVVADSHTVIEEAKAAGVYVFGGGIDAEVAPVLVTGRGAVSDETYPDVRIDGGFLVLELPSRAEAVAWAARVAAACRCPQEVREFGYDPAS